MLLFTYSIVFLAGNGGANPRHTTLFATDVLPSKVVRILDRFLMLYIRTADKLMRTARRIEQFEGGIEVCSVTIVFHSACPIMWLQKLKKVILEDELSICADLDREMDALVGTYSCEWNEVVNDPERRKQFRQFVNAVSNQPLSQGVPGMIGANRTIGWFKSNLSSSQVKPGPLIGRKRYHRRSSVRVRWRHRKKNGNGGRWRKSQTFYTTTKERRASSQPLSISAWAEDSPVLLL